MANDPQSDPAKCVCCKANAACAGIGPSDCCDACRAKFVAAGRDSVLRREKIAELLRQEADGLASHRFGTGIVRVIHPE